MTVTDRERLYILAFDHRTSFRRKLFGLDGVETPRERAQMEEGKEIILEGLLAARGSVPADSIAALVDEEIGAKAVRRAKEAGIPLAICAEKSSTTEFEFEYGDDFARHIEAMEPDFVKVLVRYNPEGNATANTRQARRLAQLSDWLIANDPRFLLELIVPPTSRQLAALNYDESQFIHQLRPELMTRAIADLQAAGVDPDIWKVEGLEHQDDYSAVAEAARANGRDDVVCVVLGAGAPQATVAHWLSEAAKVSAFVGFAIGRTIFWDPLKAWLSGSTREEAAQQIAANYVRSVADFTLGAAG